VVTQLFTETKARNLLFLCVTVVIIGYQGLEIPRTVIRIFQVSLGSRRRTGEKGRRGGGIFTTNMGGH